MDEVWCYGFTHNIYMGMIPYRDFNMILPPFYAFIMSLPFYLFGSSLLVFHIENAILLTGMVLIIYQLIGKKIGLVLPFFFFPHNILFPNYNVLLLVLFFLLLYWEKEEKSDYLIGFLLGILVLTKHTVGACLLLPSLYYWKKKGKIKKRAIGFFIPCLVFLLYLLITNSIGQFLDLCVLGLFDFGTNNHGTWNPFFYVVWILIGLLLYVIYKKRKDLKMYYLLAFVSITVPLFDYYHVWIYLMAFLTIFISYLKIEKKHAYIISGVFMLCLLASSWKNLDVSKGNYPNSIKHFEYRYLDASTVKNINYYNLILKEYKGNFVIIGNSGYLHKLSLNQKITKLDLLNSGNFGYHGYEKLMKLIQKQDQNTIYLLDKSEIKSRSQIDKKLIAYIREQGELLKEDEYYYFYFLKK